jgi:hypothetical protein
MGRQFIDRIAAPVERPLRRQKQTWRRFVSTGLRSTIPDKWGIDSTHLGTDVPYIAE